MSIAARSVLFCFLTTVQLIAVTSTFEREGNIYAEMDGRVVQLTQSGLDSGPVISPDRRLVAFVRNTPKMAIDTGLGDVYGNELWVVETTGRSPARKILTGRAGSFEVGPNLTMAGFVDLEFSNDGRRLYFMATTWVTANALWSADVTTGRRKLVVAGAIQYAVIRSGRHTGKLIVSRRSYCKDSACHPFFLMGPDGKEEARIAEGETGDLQALLKRYSK